jgi:hypothetical protein
MAALYAPEESRRENGEPGMRLDGSSLARDLESQQEEESFLYP